MERNTDLDDILVRSVSTTGISDVVSWLCMFLFDCCTIDRSNSGSTAGCTCSCLIVVRSIGQT